MHRIDMSTVDGNFNRVSRSLIERALELRCQSYLANAKYRLLMMTIMEIDSSKRDLVKTTQHLRELDKIKTLFIAGLTHEINNPLSAIIGYTQLIMMGAGGPLTDKQQNYLNSVSTAAEHLKAIVADALDIAKIESNALEPNYSEFPLRLAIEEAVSQFTQRATEKGIELTVHHAIDATLFSDKRRLVQCLINLISNAIKYTEHGTVHITTRLCDQSAVIDIADSGVGLSENDLQHLFEIFHRGVSAKRSKELGSGIGLFLTNKLATTVLHGTIHVESVLNKGSTFSLSIPLSVPAVVTK